MKRKRMSPRRRMLLAARRRIRRWRRFKFVQMNDDGTVVLLCPACQRSSTHDPLKRMRQQRGVNIERQVAFMREKFASGYWQRTGLEGRCRSCEQIERDHQYPLEGVE